LVIVDPFVIFVMELPGWSIISTFQTLIGWLTTFCFLIKAETVCLDTNLLLPHVLISDWFIFKIFSNLHARLEENNDELDLGWSNKNNVPITNLVVCSAGVQRGKSRSTIGSRLVNYQHASSSLVGYVNPFNVLLAA
jgi:hypothetical protein